jgi:hypothetical protein
MTHACSEARRRARPLPPTVRPLIDLTKSCLDERVHCNVLMNQRRAAHGELMERPFALDPYVVATLKEGSVHRTPRTHKGIENNTFIWRKRSKQPAQNGEGLDARMVVQQPSVECALPPARLGGVKERHLKTEANEGGASWQRTWSEARLPNE